MKEPVSPPRLWCIAAADAPIVGVAARLATPSRWSCILRWDLKAKRLEMGAWTTLRLKDLICKLSPDGQFLLYFGKGPLKGPFRADVGGGAAISRLPWLAALTDISPGCVAGGGPSRHGLDPASQQRLWKTFETERFYFRSDDWPGHYGKAWRAVDGRASPADQLSGMERTRAVRFGAAEIPRRGLRIILAAHRKHLNDSSRRWQQFYLESSRKPGTLRPLPEVRWATPGSTGSILVATTTGRVQELQPKNHGDPGTPFKVLQDHDLTRLQHRPCPAPAWAIRPLAAPRRGRE